MAKNNKYTAINFNNIYDKSITTISATNPRNNPNPSLSPSPSHSYSSVSAPNKHHSRILVLTRPKPVLTPPSQPQQQQPPSLVQPPRSEPGSDAISLRPLGSTGTWASLSPLVLNHDKDKDPPPPATPKPDKFVPPHLRPGFVPREDTPGPGGNQFRDSGYTGRVGQDGRPKSGGHERMRRGGGSEMGLIGRPRSSGNRPMFFSSTQL